MPDMRDAGPDIELAARRRIEAFFSARLTGENRRKVYLVSFPRSGNTLAREYLSILQGRPQLSIYPWDVVNPLRPYGLTRALDHVDIIKSHRMPPRDAPFIYLVRDGRNAMLSFLYMTFLSGGHRFSRPGEVHDALRHLDRTGGFWGDHVADAIAAGKERPALFLRFEDLRRDPVGILSTITEFLGARVSGEALQGCVRQHRPDAYEGNFYNGYTYDPENGSIYDILKRHRREDYWRLLFDGHCRRYFHERGGTAALLHFHYEQSADWWNEPARSDTASSDAAGKP
jgi:hypothetical protein